jgi:hypothetical protein
MHTRRNHVALLNVFSENKFRDILSDERKSVPRKLNLFIQNKSKGGTWRRKAHKLEVLSGE